jgi:hypothetical protein
MAAIVRKLQRLLDGIDFGDDGAEDKEDIQETLDEMEDAIGEGHDVTNSAGRLERRLNRMVERAKKNDGQPKPPGKKTPAKTTTEGDGEPKTERTHAASKSWFGA